MQFLLLNKAHAEPLDLSQTIKGHLEKEGVDYNGICFADAFVEEKGAFFSFAAAGVDGTLAIYRYKVEGWEVKDIERIAMLNAQVPFYRIDYSVFDLLSKDKLCINLSDQYYMVDASSAEKTLEIDYEHFDFAFAPDRKGINVFCKQENTRYRANFALGGFEKRDSDLD